jgi:hypothetical protein
VLEANSRPDYHQQLQKELAEVRGDEIWQIGAIVRDLRPERLPSAKKAGTKAASKPSRNGKAAHRKVVKAKIKPKKKAKARR